MLQRDLMARKPRPPKDWAPFSIRFDKETREQLEQAAADDMRPIGHLVIKIVTDWLKAKGYRK
jgi:hypothetical protein